MTGGNRDLVMRISFNGTTFFVPKPSASNTGKLSRIENFVLGKPDYTATVPTNIQVVGKQLLDVRKILSAVVDKIDPINERTITFDGTDSNVVDISNEQITFANHGLIQVREYLTLYKVTDSKMPVI